MIILLQIFSVVLIISFYRAIQGSKRFEERPNLNGFDFNPFQIGFGNKFKLTIFKFTWVFGILHTSFALVDIERRQGWSCSWDENNKQTDDTRMDDIVINILGKSKRISLIKN